MGTGRLAVALTPLTLVALSASAHAQVIEPNGTVVPVIDPDNWETDLQEYFTGEGEGIDAVAHASAEPGIFSPRCNFAATLVLSQSGSEAGLAWYNVPADPSVAPATVYEIVPQGVAVGQTVTSADIRNNSDYAGGLVGFVLTKGDMRVYYSEYQRNAFCSQCTTPGNWIMALAYPSTLDTNIYYLAFEDWEGADDRSWGQNDGDFNDKVFRISGVTCVGGGVPCDTGLLGVCQPGLMECQPGGDLVCRQQIEASPEACDNFDNDCNGEVDDGNLCPVGEVCDRGVCRPNCSGSEFPCSSPLICDPTTGLCIEPACQDIDCDVGQVCRGGSCVGACDGVVCPLGQQCQIGRCVDPCVGVTCNTGYVCEDGVCVEGCDCRPCEATQVCKASGECVDAGCETLDCPAGQACVAGACVDVCANAVCPGGAACENGQCGEPLFDGPGTPSTGSGGGGSIIVGLAGSGTIDVGTGGSDSGSGDASGAGAEDPGCGCRLGQSGPRSHRTALWLGLGVLALTGRRRRGRPRA